MIITPIRCDIYKLFVNFYILCKKNLFSLDFFHEMVYNIFGIKNKGDFNHVSLSKRNAY